LRGGVEGRFEVRVEGDSGGERGHPVRELLEQGVKKAGRGMEEETDDFNLSQIMQICAPCPNALRMSVLPEKIQGKRLEREEKYQEQ
jgi:hypothetical protein